LFFASTTVFCEIHNPAVVSTSGTGTITVVVGTAQNWQVGDSLIFVGTSDATLNGSSVASPYIITAVNSTTSYNFTQSGTHTNGAGGTVGGLYATGGTGSCKVTQNSAITPANTSYNVGLWPIFSLTSSFNTYAIGSGPVDISTIVPTPGQMPSYSFADTFSNQTIAGNKTFSGATNLNGGGSLGGTFGGSPTVTGNWLFSAIPTFTLGAFFPYITNGDCVSAGSGGNLADAGSPCAGPSVTVTAESKGAAPSQSASNNTTFIQSAMNVTGKDTLETCGQFNVNAPLVISSNTRLELSPCTQAFQAAGTNNNMIVNNAYLHRGYLSGTFTYSSGASACTNGTQAVAFTNGNGFGGFGYILVSGGVPTGNVFTTLSLSVVGPANPGSYYSAVPTQGTIINPATGASVCTGTAAFTGGSVVNAITPVSLSWNSTTPQQVTVNWTSHPFSNCAQQCWAAISNASPSAFVGTFLVENVINANSFTVRLKRNPAGVSPTVASGTSIVAMQADSNIIIDGGAWNYNGSNNNAGNGFNLGASVIIFAAANVEIRNLNLIQPRQDTIIFAAVSDAHLHDISDTGVGATQFFECQGMCYNVELDHITTTGLDDGMSFLTRIPSPSQFSSVALSYGDVANSGFRHINRMSPSNVNTLATGIAVFFASATEYMGGNYARDITGSLYGAIGGPDIACVALSALAANSQIDTFEAENINCTGTWSFRITNGTAAGATLTVNHWTAKHLTCNPQETTPGNQEGEECLQVTAGVTFGRGIIERMNYSSTAHTSGSVWLAEIGATFTELDFIDCVVLGPNLSNPVGMLNLTAGSVPGQITFERVKQTNTSAMLADNSTTATAFTVTIRDSTVNANEVVAILAGAAGSSRNYVLRDNTFTGLANGAIDVITGSATTTVNVFSSGNSIAGGGNTNPAVNNCGGNCVVNLYDSGERNAWTFSSSGTQIQPTGVSGPCQGVPIIQGSGFNAGTISGTSYCAFAVTVGTGTASSNSSLTMPFTVPNRYVCSVENITSPSTRIDVVTSVSNTVVAVSNYALSGGAYSAANFTNGDVILFLCGFQ